MAHLSTTVTRLHRTPCKGYLRCCEPEVEDTVWWKDGFERFDPKAFDDLLERVVSYLNNKQGDL